MLFLWNFTNLPNHLKSSKFFKNKNEVLKFEKAKILDFSYLKGQIQLKTLFVDLKTEFTLLRKEKKKKTGIHGFLIKKFIKTKKI